MKKLSFFLMAMLFSVMSFAAETVAYTLTPAATGSNSSPHNAYASAADWTYEGITWNVTGNSYMVPWRIGGKSITAVNRAVYTKTAMAADITKIEITHATVNITCNSCTLTVSDAANGAGETFPVKVAQNTTTTITLPEGDYSNKFYKLVYNVTNSTTSNKYVQLSEIKFYTEVQTSVEAPTFTPEEGKVAANNTFAEPFALTIASATTDATIKYTLDGTDPTLETALTYEAPITISTMVQVRAIAVKGEEKSVEASVAYIISSSEAKPYTASEAIAAEALGLTGTVYVTGTVKSIEELSTQYGNATYNITDGTKELKIYRGKNLENAKFTSADQLLVGDVVVVKGDLTSYNGAAQLGQNNYLISRSTPVINHTITVSANPAEGGVVTGGGEFEETDEITVKAVANENYVFVNWTENDVEVSTEAEYTFEVLADRDLVANFQVIPCTQAIAINWDEAINAEANADKWYAVNIASAKEAAKDLELTVSNPGEEAVKVTVEVYADCPATMLIAESTATINAGASKTKTVGYFDIFADLVDVIYFHVITEGGEIKVEAETAKFNVTATAENGTVEGAGVYEQGAEATLTATPAEGYEFVNWTSGETVVSTENPYKFTVTADVALVANFKKAAPAKLYLTPNANWKKDNARFAAYFFGNGETWVSMTKVAGETGLYEVTIPTDKKYPNVIFCRMNPSASANNWNNKWNQTADLVIPTDGKNHYTVKENTWDKGGGTWSIWPVPTVKTYVDITITVTANAPASIKWANAGDKLADATEYVAMTAGENNTYTYTLAQVDEAKGVDYTIKVGDIVSTTQNTSKNVTVDFKNLLPQVAIEGIDGKWDSSNKMTISDDYLTASITLPLAAKDHVWKLTIDAAWLGGSKFVITRTNNSVVVKEDAGGDGKLTADIAGDYVFTWTYATQTLTVTYPAIPVKYNVTVTAENGTVEGAGEYEEGATATLTATANEGYEFVNWTKGEEVVSTENPYSFVVTADVALVANFQEAAPEYEVMELTMTNLTVGSYGDGITGLSASDMDNGIEVMLFLDAEGNLMEESSIMVGWSDYAVTGTVTKAYNEELATDVYTAELYTTVGETNYKLIITMYYVPVEATVVVVENATIDDQTETSGFLYMNGEWTDAEGIVYPVSAEVPGFDATVSEAVYSNVTVTVGGWGDNDPWLGFVQGDATVTVADNVVTLVGTAMSSWDGLVLDVTITGNLPVVEPTTITYELNGGEFPAVVVPTNAELWEAFKPYYNEYYGLARADQPIDKVSTFASAKMQEIMTDEASEYKWLGDYVQSVATAAGVPLSTDMASANESGWRWAVHAFFNAAAGQYGAAGIDFTEAGKQEVWGAAYEAEYGVVLPTEPVAEDYVLPTPTKEGYTFVGWYDNAEGTGEPYKVIPAGWAGTLYAIWKQDTTTALDNIAVEGKAVKAIINGQLIIIKNGVQYNAQGVILK